MCDGAVAMPMLSIVVPTLNEADRLAATLAGLRACCTARIQLIVVDGGSVDDTVGIARRFADRVICGVRGRALQMNAGAGEATGEVLWFVHADTVAPPTAGDAVLGAMGERDAVWGYFDVRLDGEPALLRVVERMMKLRTRVTGVATGDQGIWVRRSVFEAVGGYAPLPLMEDVALSKRLRRLRRPLCLPLRLSTSARRWQVRGTVRTVMLMWWLRLAFWLGVSPETLARWYR